MLREAFILELGSKKASKVRQSRPEFHRRSSTGEAECEMPASQADSAPLFFLLSPRRPFPKRSGVCVCILSVVSRTTVSGVPVCSTNRMLRQSCVRTADCFAGHCQGSGAPYLRRDTVRANFRLNFGFISAVTTRGVRRRGLINTTTTMYNRRSIT